MSTRGAKAPATEMRETAAGLNGDAQSVRGHVAATQSSLTDRSHTQDVASTRAKATRHGKMTAENANQGESPRGR